MRKRIFLLPNDAYAHTVFSMNQMQHIRTNILGISQKEMAGIVERDQATISRWERGSLEPSRDDLVKIRKFAMKRESLTWSDSLFFEVSSPSNSP
jgi:transcriptional regulator with XRE-family HTH domain